MTRLLLALGLLVLAGCAAPAPGVERLAVEPVTPVSIDIFSIRVHSSLIATGLNPDGTLQVPDVHTPGQASWYVHSPVPGQVGPAVVLGHVNGDGQPGVFARLHQLEPGDPVRVARSDGAVARFAVTEVRSVPKDRFPTEQVYRDTPNPQLVLITCGGELDRAARSYRSNVIVRAAYTP